MGAAIRPPCVLAPGRPVGGVAQPPCLDKNASPKHFTAAGFICTGIAKIPGGTLIFATMLDEGTTEGAVTGGTGKLE